MLRAGLTTLVVLALTLGGCGTEIGDGCNVNTDCDPQGTRVCDPAQPGGYCTIEGCDDVSNRCPGEAACIRFFPVMSMTSPCSPEHESSCTSWDPDCDPDTDPACCRCLADELCIAEGYCVRRELERRNCMRKCGGSSDCRDGYQCYPTGIGGAETIPASDGSEVEPVSFCAPAR